MANAILNFHFDYLHTSLRFTISGHFGPFGPPRNTDEPAIFGLFWSKKLSLGLFSLQMTKNDQNQRDVSSGGTRALASARDFL